MRLRVSAAVLIASVALSLSGADDGAFVDPLDAGSEVPERRALRGDWQIAGGVAICTQDDALYKKFKDHGPIIFYDLPTVDATFRYAFKPQGCKSVVFTLNAADGHVFRFVTGERGTSVRAFPPDGEAKSIQTTRSDAWLLNDGEWTQVEVKVEGSKVRVKFGDHQPVTVEHASYARARSNWSVGFSFGTLAVKGVEVLK